jgi:hypothetical protein
VSGLLLYFLTKNQIKNKVKITPLITPGFMNPGKNGVAKEERTFRIGMKRKK